MVPWGNRLPFRGCLDGICGSVLRFDCELINNLSIEIDRLPRYLLIRNIKVDIVMFFYAYRIDLITFGPVQTCSTSSRSNVRDTVNCLAPAIKMIVTQQNKMNLVLLQKRDQMFSNVHCSGFSYRRTGEWRMMKNHDSPLR